MHFIIVAINKMNWQSNMHKILTILSTPDAIISSGFMIGFVHSFKFSEQTLESPLSSLLNASMSGFLTCIGATFVADFIPPQLKFIIPLLAICSCVYYKVNDLFPPKNPPSKIKHNINVSN